MSNSKLLWIVEYGGYPDYRPVYQRLGCEVLMENSMRKARSTIKKHEPKVIVAEFNYQSDFRDRTSSLETLQSLVQYVPHSRVIVFYDREDEPQLAKLETRFRPFRKMAHPIDEAELEANVKAALAD